MEEEEESHPPNQGWWCLALAITSAHSFLRLVSVLRGFVTIWIYLNSLKIFLNSNPATHFSLLYLYVSHMTMMLWPPLKGSL